MARKSYLPTGFFNQCDLNKLLRSQKQSNFLYKPNEGFCDGQCIIADNEQLKQFLKDELLSDGNSTICRGFGETQSRFDLMKRLNEYESKTLLPASITDFFHHNIMLKKSLSRVLKTDSSNFLIAEKYIQLINRRILNVKLFTVDGLQLIVKDSNGKTLAMFLGIRSDSIFAKGVKSIN